MKSILIIDDDAQIRKLMEDIILPEGHRVLQAESADEAIALLRERKIDIIFLDIMMPGRTGAEVLSEFLQIQPEVLVIIQSGYASLKTAIQAIKLGAYDYIEKPIREEQLLQSLQRAIERKNLQEQNKILIERLKQKASRLKLLNRVARVITSTLDIKKLLDLIMDMTKSVLEAEASALILIDEEKDELYFESATGVKESRVKEIRMKKGKGIAGWVAERGKPLRVPDVSKDPRFFKGVDEKTGFKTRSILAAPLISKGKTIGIIEVVNRRDNGPFTEFHQELLMELSNYIAPAVENAQMARALEQSRMKIQEYSRTLEQKVEERTRELKEAQAQLIQSEKLSSIGLLAAGIAHEINNPMGFINSNLFTFTGYIRELRQILTEYEQLEGDCQGTADEKLKFRCAQIKKVKERIDLEYIMNDLEKVIEESNEGARRVIRIVKGLKNFSHIDEERPEYADINETLEETLNVIWNELKYKAEVIKEYGDLPEIECYPRLLTQVFMNLLLNAAQAIEKEGRIVVKTYTDNGNIYIRISDNGCGIPPENLPKLFDPFFTTKEVGKGTGLGLSMAYGIIERHKGKIQVESEVGKGSTFTIELPLGGMVEGNI